MQDILVEQNIIITEPSRNLRALGRNARAGKWKTAIITVIVYLLCMTIPPLVFDSLFGVNLGNLFINDGYTYDIDVGLYAELYNTMPTYSILSGIYILLITGPLTLGLTMFFLAMFRKHKVETVDMFLGFEKFGKSLGLMLFQMLFIYLWSLLFIIPGIIASIRYSQAFFILADDPSKGIRQCMNESKAMMKGNKAKYFCLSLSFIGWLILSSLPATILESIGHIITTNAFIVSLFAAVGYLFIAPVTAYMFSTMSGFYEILAGHLIKETQPAPIPEDVYALEQPEESTDSSFEPPAEPPVEEATEAPAEEATEPPAEDPVETPTEEPVEEKAADAAEVADEAAEPTDEPKED